MLEAIKSRVCAANIRLRDDNLIKLTWGNVSEYYEEENCFVIKPSGVPYSELTPDKMVVCDMNCVAINSDYKPSSDALTHLEIYKANPQIKSVVHTHSKWATIWAQSGLSIPILGTTHADTFATDIPCVPAMDTELIEVDYERNTGKSIINYFIEKGYDFSFTPGVILEGHGPFTWGKNVTEALENTIVLEEVAEMAYYTLQLNPKIETLNIDLKNKHFERKHGKNAYYGQ